MAHDGHALTLAGAPLTQARAAVLLLHGRGDSARGILGLADVLGVADIAYAAPQAEGHTWYPQSFLQPFACNEPYLSQALAAVTDALGELGKAGFDRENIVLMGFSQGACLALESAARNAGRFGGVVAFSGGLIGPDDAPRDYPGALEQTPVFLGCSDVDMHIPKARVLASAEIMLGLGGAVDARIYPGMGHTINEDELGAARAILAGAKRA